MNTQKGKARFKKFRILLDSGCISTIVIRRLITKLNLKEDAVIQWCSEARNITTNIKVKIYLTLPKLRAKKTVTWNWHMNDYAKGRYDTILGRDILIA